MSNFKSFKGTGTAIITPFTADGIDYRNFGRLIDWQIEKKVEFLVVLGTTGESPAVSEGEREEIIRFALSAVKGRIPVVIGTGGNNTPHAVESSRKAEALGADGVLVVTPYYNKPSQEGLFRHFKTVADGIKIPVSCKSAAATPRRARSFVHAMARTSVSPIFMTSRL
ncbi:hypothetical protein FACS1894204_12130 [Synergistales bacterium]|nr:hypothetical protein FACS1894204_12130 [Synergistales bacterium]